MATNGDYDAEPEQGIQMEAQVTTNPGETVASYTWDFGDGQTGSGAVVTHSYSDVGVYVVSLTVVTNLDQGSATTTATVQHSTNPPSDLDCEICFHDERLRWNSLEHRLDARARLWMDPARAGTLEYRSNEVVLRATITRPDGRVVFDTGVAGKYEGLDDISADFSAFHRSADARQPMRGLWTLRVLYYYHFIEHPPDRPLVLLNQAGPETVELNVEGTCDGPCDISPREVRMDDGDPPVALSLLNPLPGRTYQWTWRIPWISEQMPGNGPPEPNLSTTAGPSTTVRPRWVAYPNVRCLGPASLEAQALVKPEYLFAVSTGGQTSQSESSVTVRVPWGFDPSRSLETPGGGLGTGLTSGPNVDFDFSRITCSAEFCRVDPSSLVDFSKTPGRIEYAPGIQQSGSAFFAKVRAHEEDHQHFQVDPQRCGSRYWTESSVRSFISACAADSSSNGCAVPIIGGNEAEARSLARARLEIAKERWRLSEADAYVAQRAFLVAEKEGWAAGDIPPRFLYESCNAPPAVRAASPNCPR